MEPTTRLDTRYSNPAAEAAPWAESEQRVAGAEVAWLVSVREDGRPHSTPVVPVWHEGKAYFHTGPGEQKYDNLLANPHVLLLAGDTNWDGGLDVVIEGTAAIVRDEAVLKIVAELNGRRWDGRWKLTPLDGQLSHRPGFSSTAFEITPTKAFGHAKGDPFGQTNYRF